MADHFSSQEEFRRICYLCSGMGASMREQKKPTKPWLNSGKDVFSSRKVKVSSRNTSEKVGLSTG